METEQGQKEKRTKKQGSKQSRKRRLCGPSTFSYRTKLMYHPGFELIRSNYYKVFSLNNLFPPGL
jgi:hypothetical protein